MLPSNPLNSPERALSSLSNTYLNILAEPDRAILQSAAAHATIQPLLGSAVGLSLGLLAATRVHSVRITTLQSLRQHANIMVMHSSSLGRRLGSMELWHGLPTTNRVPFLSRLWVANTHWTDAVTYLGFGINGLGLGYLSGSQSGKLTAQHTMIRDPEAWKRIEMAFSKLKVRALRHELQLKPHRGVDESDVRNSQDKLRAQALGLERACCSEGGLCVPNEYLAGKESSSVWLETLALAGMCCIAVVNTSVIFKHWGW
ncbi:hypothetical protein B0T16DRAFT_462246 [Cercophora newfieldiana]|uniref:Uncharacterized protein n=1 Tax=Cercophora newfieldiana TaxID=92897 RepID=A0AA40CHH3_9PEZI|nr:hypothetical protein B0T16DRAFT_462246 [Cercophora newfieldiana]